MIIKLKHRSFLSKLKYLPGLIKHNWIFLESEHNLLRRLLLTIVSSLLIFHKKTA